VREDGEALVAFVEPASGAEPEGRELRRFLMDRLPRYMVPASVEVLQALPLTPTRKVDRQALRGSERLD
jgi:acyl-CoA synthetase (AMP-forming)/AMP-acid ligase II